MKAVIFLISILVFTSFVSAAFGYNDLDGPILSPDQTLFNNATASVNISDFWNTNLGSLGNVNATQFDNNAGTLTLDTFWLNSFGDSFWCKLTGCTMAGDIDMGTNDINNINNVNILNDLDVGDNVDVHGSVKIDEILNVTGKTYLNDDVFVDGDITADNFIGDGSGLTGINTEDSNVYKIYFNSSIKNVITYNISDSDASIISVSTVGGKKIIYGGEFA